MRSEGWNVCSLCNFIMMSCDKIGKVKLKSEVVLATL